MDDHQSAYRPDYSVETLLTNLSDDILREMDKGNVTVVVLLDMSAAFDTVDHPILIKRLESRGVTGSALEWFKSYLTNRTQYVTVDQAKSKSTKVVFGVPQGSVGGPFLFSLYLQSLGDVIKSNDVQYHCYADDIQLYVSFPPSSVGLKSAKDQLEKCIKEIKMWMNSNGLKLNENKTELIVFGSTSMLSKINAHNISLCVGENNIQSVNKVRNLGVIFDSNMSFNNQISNISRSIRYQLRNLSFIRKSLTKDATEKLIHALISSRLDFCNSVLSGLPLQQINRLQSLQNSAARLLTLTKKTSHITPILRTLHWLPVQKRIQFKILMLVYRAIHHLAPKYMQDSLIMYRPTRSLRSSNSLFLQVPRTVHSWGDNAFSHMGPTLWNRLPISLRNAPTLQTFKQHLKTYLFDL